MPPKIFSAVSVARQISALLRKFDQDKKVAEPNKQSGKEKSYLSHFARRLSLTMNQFLPLEYEFRDHKGDFLKALDQAKQEIDDMDLSAEQKSFLEDFSLHLSEAFKDVFHEGELHYYEPQSKLDDDDKKDPTYNAASFFAKFLQCFVNSFSRQVSVNIGTIVSNKGAAGLAKEMASNPASLYSRFYSRVPGNFFAIQPSIQVAKSLYDIDPVKMTHLQRILSVGAGVTYETFAGAPFELYSLLTGFNATKVEACVESFGVEKFLSGLSDPRFWRIVSPVSEEMAPFIIKNPQLMAVLRASGIDFSSFDAMSSQADKIKEIGKIFDLRVNATKLAVCGNCLNIFFTKESVIKAIVEKLPEAKVKSQDFAKIFTATFPSNFLRNSPFLLSLFYGLKDKNSSVEKVLAIATLLGAASAYPSSISTHVSTSILSGSSIFKAIGEGVIKATNDVPTSRFAIAASSRVLANYFALAIFHEGVGDYLSDGFYKIFKVAFGSEEKDLLPEQERIIDDICTKEFAKPKVSRMEDDELTRIISEARSFQFLDRQKKR